LKHEFKKELVDAGCPAHILHNYIQHGTNTLSLAIECIIMKIYNYFSVCTVRTEDLESYCEFVDSYCHTAEQDGHHCFCCEMITADVLCHEIIVILPI
jgi:hypothetical protein